MAIKNNNIIQIAIVVEDIEKVAKNYEQAFGLEKQKIENLPSNKVVPTYYKGKPVDVSDCKICVIKMGNMVLELMEPGQSDNVWKDFLKEHGQGVQHIGIMVDDEEEALDTLKEFDSEVTHVGYFSKLTYAFVDSVENFGVSFNIKQGDIDNSEKIKYLLENSDEYLKNV